MIRGLYTAATGMIAEQFVQDSLAGNLANINTVGFKQDIPTFRALHEMALRRYGSGADNGGAAIGTLGLGVQFDGSIPDPATGPMMRTEQKTDIALSGPGYFAVMTPQGERYTRDGQFKLDTKPDGVFLTDGSGNRVLGKNGPINMKDVTDFSVTDDGRIMTPTKEIDQFKLVDFPMQTMRKIGGNLYSASAPPTKAKPNVRQGYLEQSNVNAVTSMVRMISIQRAYEAAARAVTAQDETLGKAVNEVGRL
jgi:flagellar basal-body rod protein FlgG